MKKHGKLIRLRPRAHQMYVSENRTCLITDLDGWVYGKGEQGLFEHQTRILSRYRFLLNGRPPLPVAQSNIEQHDWMGYYIHNLGSPKEPAQQVVELRVSRFVGDGMHEDVDLTNFTQERVSLVLELESDADFMDQKETRWAKKNGRGGVDKKWKKDGASWELSYDFTAEHEYDHQGEKGRAAIHRGVALRFENMDPVREPPESGPRFSVSIPPHGRWHLCINALPRIENRWLKPTYSCYSFHPDDKIRNLKRSFFLSQSTRFETVEETDLSEIVATTLEQGRKDLVALRFYDEGSLNGAWTLAAGLPTFTALFGRDTLTAGWQAALVTPEIMKGTLAELARWQGARINDWRDEQPGRMLHEAQTGPLSSLNYDPHGRIYSSATTSSFYAVVLSELWHWTGDRELVYPFIEPALKAIQWLDRYGDLDGDGFYEYKTRSKNGLKNQGWKDSSDSIVYEDGSQVEAPIATCEEQAFVYAAKLHLSEVLWWFGRKEEARTLFRQARELKRRFNEAFWMEEEGFIALGLDSRKRPIRSISSNPGHCIAAGIVDKDYVGEAAARLLEDDLFSGWGVRTLSSDHPAYNPFSYQRGSVWPVEQGTFALGFYRYGLHSLVGKLARAQFETAALFDFCRLPEVFSGHARDREHPFPALYPDADWPQAWSASAVFCLLQSILGLYPYAPLKTLMIDPHLPVWLPEITLRRLRMGQASLDIRFFRKKSGGSDYEIVNKRGAVHVLRQPSPWSLTTQVTERVKDAILSALPGR